MFPDSLILLMSLTLFFCFGLGLIAESYEITGDQKEAASCRAKAYLLALISFVSLILHILIA